MMMPANLSGAASKLPELTRQRELTPLAATGAVLLITVISLLAAVIASQTANGFTFGVQAAASAGERPPRDVSMRVESLMMQEAYANALLTGAALGLLLFTASSCLKILTKNWRQTPLLNLLQALIVSVVWGCVCLALACLAFRVQKVGTQDLVIATLVHAMLWAGLGVIVFLSMKRPLQSGRKRPMPVIAGFVWGTVFSTFAVLFYPDVYVERLFSTPGMISLWAGVGCFLVLASGLWESRNNGALSTRVEGGTGQ